MKKQKRRKSAPEKDVVSTDGSIEESDPSVTKISPEDLDDLPEKVRSAVVQASRFSGPLPPPDLYEEYEKVLPGSADRILAMAEKEQSQRHTFEDKMLVQHSGEIKLGQKMGGFVAIICVGGAVVCAISGELVGAVILISTPIVSLVYQFINGRRAPRIDT